ncbi:MAG: coproporphyrinogen-III oxidase family protein [Desulfovermiculus sp.]|nr:coproporphyrinogen-III oxidase family protein [Desulfovermiculus sp.]
MHLYLHVPFCRKKCAYCGFASAPPGPGEMTAYVRAVIQEMEHRAPQIEGRRVQTVFMGGGTPSLLSVSHLGQILEAAGSCFALSADAEITVEANPDSVHNPDQVRAWKKLGVTRISLGIQSLDQEILRFLGRTHTPQQARGAVQCLDQAGMDNFSLDLIWGIPGQDLRLWLGTLQEAVAWNPAHLSLYSLSIESGTPLAALEAGSGRVPGYGLDLPQEETSSCSPQKERKRKYVQRDKELQWPDEDTWADMFVQGRELLIQAGFEHYEISNYARPGRKCRHNSGIWRGEDYMGLGPAAVSTMDGVRRQNPESLVDYVRMLDHGHPLPDEEVLSQRTRDWEKAMLGLRTNQGVDLTKAAYGVDRRFVCQLEEAGLLEMQNGRLGLTPRGMLVSNEILARMLS